jgi:molecular chaperone GrpE
MTSDPKDPLGQPPANDDALNAELGVDAASADIANQSAHIAALTAELKDLKDRYLRAAAETENTRRRAERERVEAGQFAIQRFAKDLLEVADNFRRALEALPASARQGLSPQVANLLTGIEATENQMLSIFERHQLKRLTPKGERFDPHLHQAIAEAPHAEVPEGHVTDVAQVGFTLAGRLIRPAMVVVSKGSAGLSPPADAPKANGHHADHAPPGSRLDTKA